LPWNEFGLVAKLQFSRAVIKGVNRKQPKRYRKLDVCDGTMFLGWPNTLGSVPDLPWKRQSPEVLAIYARCLCAGYGRNL